MRDLHAFYVVAAYEADVVTMVRCSGSTTAKVVPLPTVLVTLMRP
jgi:hypothetical protein